MYRAFLCSDYYGSSVAILGFQRLNLIALRRPNLGNPHLACVITISATNCRMRRSTFSPHIAVVLRFVLLLNPSATPEEYHSVTFVIAFRHGSFNSHWTIVLPIQASSLCLSFYLVIQSPHGNLWTYAFTDMLHSPLGFPAG